MSNSQTGRNHILVIDDLRTFDFDATYARTVSEGMALVSHPKGWDEVWLDHDLGGKDTIRPVVVMLETRAYFGYPANIGLIVICTDNPVGRKWMLQALEKYYPCSISTAPFRIPKSGI